MTKLLLTGADNEPFAVVCEMVIVVEMFSAGNKVIETELLTSVTAR